MTIQEAIRTGKRFRRAGDKFYDAKHVAAKHWSNHYPRFTIDDVLATDWEAETEEQAVTIYEEREA